MIDHNPKLKTEFDFSIKTLEPSSLKTVSWTHGDQVKSVALNLGPDTEEQVEETLLETFYGRPLLATNDNYFFAKTSTGGKELVRQYHLTYAEVAAIRSYTGSIFMQVNNALRSGCTELKSAEPYIKVVGLVLERWPS
ncbi:hypothetical protein WDW86_08745 [Bdellovibrionota bacterium FG-2]